MHYWGDEWFEENGNDLYAAIDFIEKYLRKHHIGICGKEKYGTYRDEYLRFWSGGLYPILFGHRVSIRTYVNYKYKWMETIANKFHSFIYFRIDLGSIEMLKDESLDDFRKRCKKRWWKGLEYYSEKTGLLKFVHDYQAKHYNYAFQLACKQWPNITNELIVMTDGYKMIKPCKYGDIDGEEIHNKYWNN